MNPDPNQIPAMIQRIGELTREQKPIPTQQQARLQQIDNIRFVVFDVYGTMLVARSGDIGLADLTDDVDALAAAFESLELDYSEKAPQAGTEIFRKVIEEDHQLRREEGVDYPEVDITEIWREVLMRLKNQNLLEGDLSDPIPAWCALEFEIRFNPPWPMPTLEKTLDRLRSREIKLGIVSNSQFYSPLSFPALTGRTLTDLGFNPYLLIWSYEYGIAKPSIDLYKLLSDPLDIEFGTQPEEVLYVGNDMLNDVWPAQQLGMKTALFAGDKRSLKLREGHEKCHSIEPDLVITQLDQVLECVGA